ncbi:AprI/Inh family metalloprotease inhibitor [Microvirga pudoricolor]|uniref:AprI/Inh family metalloprotease inhibitor n=1 Tax=Microvirga pudoricolor TaxID=2778729 RepID=UPI00194DFAF1|nr:AprI/Inh family metalloprotease inhibitor [Microvirga pudoricolor]MBM6593550.1 AprI/Inh family metalloprotease inhibitor [Microvirga pudoricolor]
MSRRIYALAVLSCATLALGACSSARLGGAPIRSAAAAPVMTPAPVEPMPAGPIETAPLAPVESQPLPPVVGAPVAPGGTDIAALPPPAAAPAAPAAPASRSSLVGAWTAQVTGSACRLQLSSAPALDLYRASSTGCANQDLSRVNAWDYRNGEIYLYQTGGAVVARVRGSSASLSGALTKSGGPISLVR